MRCSLVLASLLVLNACQPPAADEYVERARIGPGSEGPSEPIDSPDTEDAIWAAASEGDRLLYGEPGERPLMAFACVVDDGAPMIRYTRFAPADAHAKAVLAMIGNGHVSRFKIDAVSKGSVWLWEGEIGADSPQLDVLTGRREVEATVPGAGSLVLNPSAFPAELVERCRSLARTQAPGR